jgi:signal transduction histidine kinase
VGDPVMIFDNNDEETMTALNIVHQKENDLFTAEIVHEIRNPLTAVKGFLQLIKPYLTAVGKEQYAEVALTELNRAHQLISDYLTESNRQANTLPNKTLNKIITDLVLLYENEAEANNIQLETDLSKSDVILKIPESRLKQIMINIIKNAIEALAESKTQKRMILISTETDTSTAVINISDSCGGISNKTMESLFTPYISSKETGTGIGLYISKKIIESYDGTIHVESINGEQTTFTICFPIHLRSI